MDAQPHTPMSADEFIAWSMEQPDGSRYELSDGRVVQMPSERLRHAMVKGEVFFQLHVAARASGLVCEILPDGVSVQINAHTVYEPDAAVRVGPKLDPVAVKYDDPVVVVEVLSPSTKGIDVGAKLDDYFSLPSVQHYLILHPDRNRVIHHQRDGGDIRTRLLATGTLHLDPLGLTLDVASLFA